MKPDFNDLFYVCSMIEYVSRITKNKRGVVVKRLGTEGVIKQFKDACVNHCLSFEQVADEWIENYNIPFGDFETVENCKYDVPNYTDIGKLYAYLIDDCNVENYETAVIDMFSSFLSDNISNFNSDLYYQNPDYLLCCYREGKLID